MRAQMHAPAGIALSAPLSECEFARTENTHRQLPADCKDTREVRKVREGVCGGVNKHDAMVNKAATMANKTTWELKVLKRSEQR